MKMKLHIQLEPFNGVKYDFVEVEVSSTDEIKQAYEMLGVLKPNTPAPTAMERAASNTTAANQELAFYKKGTPVMDKNKQQLTVAEYNRAKQLFKEKNVMVWDLTKAELQ